MNSKEFLKAVEVLTKEKGLDKDVIFDAMELALTSAYKKNFHSLNNVKVFIDKEKGEIGEAVNDLNDICQLGYDEEDDREELSEALEEIIEYVRTIAALFYTHFRPLIKEKPVLH